MYEKAFTLLSRQVSPVFGLYMSIYCLAVKHTGTKTTLNHFFFLKLLQKELVDKWIRS